jgi:hypothetical protein
MSNKLLHKLNYPRMRFIFKTCCYSLYSLKRALKIWFETLCSHPRSIGLQSSKTSPCLFIGNLIPGVPAIYVGIYLDDIIYFSDSDHVEQEFEQLLGSLFQLTSWDKFLIFL